MAIVLLWPSNPIICGADYLGEYPSLCVRSMHAVPTQCKNFPLDARGNLEGDDHRRPGQPVGRLGQCVPRLRHVRHDVLLECPSDSGG